MGLFDKVSPETVHEYAKRMWNDKLKVKYPFHAESPSNIDPSSLPELPYGRHGSVVMQKGIRTWGFEREFSRDQFVINHQGAKAL